MQVGDITLFGETTFRNQCRQFGIKTDDRRRHMYLIGKTGMGKSTALENLIYSDIMAGHGIAVVDPHGDLVEKIIDYVPTNRVNDVVYFNPADIQYPIAFNVMENVDPTHQHLIASGLIGVFKKLWADSWGPRLEYVLRNAILALLDYPGSTLLGVMRLLTDREYRKKVVEKIKDPVVKAFWVDEYARYPDKFQIEAIAPIQNKVGQFISNSLIRNVVGQVKSSIDMRGIMDERKILFVNLAKGRIGEDTSQLLGAMMITKLQLAAMERIDIPELERKDFYLYVDEFQNFATDSFANILSEARKYRLNLIIAHQYIEQLSEVVKPAVFGNVGTLVCFRVGGLDAEELITEFTPHFEEEDLTNLPKYNVYLKLMIDGVASEPFSARILPPLTQEMKTGNREKIIKVSRERYSKPRQEIEEKIARWSGVMGFVEEGEEGSAAGVGVTMSVPHDDRPPRRDGSRDRPKGPPPIVVLPKPDVVPVRTGAQAAVHGVLATKKMMEEEPSFAAYSAEAAASAAKAGKASEGKESKRAESEKPKETFQATCHRCATVTTLTFKPDGTRPVYCKECLKVVRSEDAKKKNVVMRAAALAQPVPVKAAPEPGLSFAAALQQGPKSFKQPRRERREEPQTSPQSSPDRRGGNMNPSPLRRGEGEVHEQPASRPITHVQPGQVVKIGPQ